jgi:hypothetical protein
LNPVWVPDVSQTSLAVDLIANAETLGDITGSGIQTPQSIRFPRWILDPNHYFQLTETDERSTSQLISELIERTGGRINRDDLSPVVQWFLKLATFFLLFRPSQGTTTLNSLRQEEQDRFTEGFTRGAGRIFKSHVTLIAHNTVSLGRRIDPNDLYDALQLLSLRETNRLFVTNERSFFRYREDPSLQRVVPWESFRRTPGAPTSLKASEPSFWSRALAKLLLFLSVIYCSLRELINRLLAWAKKII